eukprot:TRINITY_DN6249_c0_g2_i1.p1 TRINITY_DN6249_c0_g2~~TRINITY_DN6249_c0_g2_i1.p1  ORF type:complete len:228 (+),score=45.97 TRINITY_DN6249_c0_g2_i1:76-759(+)
MVKIPSLIQPTVTITRPLFLFGIGDSSSKYARGSVGSLMLQLLAKRYRVGLKNSLVYNAEMGFSQKENVIFANPFRNKEELSLKSITNKFQCKEGILIYYDHTLPIGDISTELGTNIHNSKHHQHIFGKFNTESFHHIKVGIGLPAATNRFVALEFAALNQDFLHSLFHTSQIQYLSTQVIEKVATAVDQSIDVLQQKIKDDKQTAPSFKFFLTQQVVLNIPQNWGF